MSIKRFLNQVFTRHIMAASSVFPYDLAETMAGTFLGGLQTLSGSEQFQDGAMVVKATHRIFCPAGTVILASDKIKHGDRVFEVRSIDAIELRMGHHKEILVEEIK
jgi:head-tail adaptor